MSVEQLKLDISNWVLNWVSVHNDTLDHAPCPFAKQAVINNKIDFATVNDLDGVENLCKLLLMGGINGELLIIGMDKTTVAPNILSKFIKDINNSLLMPAGFVALEDHPDDEEFVAGVKMNQGVWILILIQSLDKINQASLILQKQGYYDNWTVEEFDDVVSWRFKKD